MWAVMGGIIMPIAIGTNAGIDDKEARRIKPSERDVEARTSAKAENTIIMASPRLPVMAIRRGNQMKPRLRRHEHDVPRRCEL